MARRVGFVILAALVLVGGCAAEPAAPEWGGTIEVRDGVRWVLNPEEGLWQGEEPPFTLELDASFGNDPDGPEDGLLRLVSGATVDGAGNVYVVDSWDNRVVAFASDGSYRWSLDSEGEGPGDLSNPYEIAWDGGDRLYFDNQNAGRVDWVSTDGEYLGSQPLSDYEIVQGWIAGFARSDAPVVRKHVRSMDGAHVFIFDATTSPWTVTADFLVIGGREEVEGGFGGWRTPVRVEDGVVSAGHQILYQLQRFGLDGTLAEVWERPLPPLLAPIVYKGTGTTFGEYDAPVQLPSGHHLVRTTRVLGIEDHDDFRRQWDEYLASGARDDFRDRTSELDLLDHQGRYIGSIAVGLHEQVLTVDAEGYLYTSRFEPEPHVRRYRVVLAPQLLPREDA